MKKNSPNNKGILHGRGPNGTTWGLILCILAALLFLFWYNSLDQSKNYSEFLDLVEADKVKSVVINDQHVGVELKDQTRFVAAVIPSDTLWKTLRSHNVDMTVYVQEKQGWLLSLLFSLLPFLLIFLFFYFRQGQGGGGAGGAGKIFSVGKSKAKVFAPGQNNITFKDVAGAVEAKEELKDIVEFLKTPEKFERLGAKIPRGVLLSGSPGNGKTLLAKAVAGEAGCQFLSISGSDFVEVFVGVGASRVRDLFIQARKNSPCIVFIDEIDAVGRQRGVGIGGGNDEREQTLNQLLSEMDGFSTEAGAVIVLAATNRQDVLDKALLRPGRFDRIVEVPYPDLASRLQILKVHGSKVKLDEGVQLDKIARGTPGFSGADLANLINEAALAASKANKEFIHIEDFEEARDRILLGLKSSSMVLLPKEKRMTAYHEAGHALINLLELSTDPFHKVTIMPRGRTLGVSFSLPESEKYQTTKSEIIARIKVALGGLLAEKLMFNEQTTGVSNDLEKATQLAKAMVCRYGMSDLGPVVFGKTYDDKPDYSEDTARKVDAEISKIMEKCKEEGAKLLEDNKDKLTLLAETLFEKETLLAHEVYVLLGIEPREMHSFRGQEEESSFEK